MSLINNDSKNEIQKIDFLNKKTFTKEMLQELLKKNLNQRLTKLESSNKEQISTLNYTSKYFKEFSKAIQQFSKFFEESELIKEKERELIEKKENLEINKDNSLKIISKKSNESGGSSNLQKNSSKIKINNKKLENSLKTRSNTQAVFKSQQFKKQANNILTAKNLFSSRINEEKKLKPKTNSIISPDREKNSKSLIKPDTPQKIQKSKFFLERNTVNFKVPKTEKRIKAKQLKNKESNRNSSKYNNISEHKTENEKYFSEKNNINSSKYSTSLKKSINKNSKIDIKNKKEITFNLGDSIKSSNNDFSKTLNNKFINKTIDIDDNEKLNYIKSSFSTKKKRKIKLNNETESSNINDIKDIVKLVDNVHQNITKLLESNDMLNNNRSLMMSSLDMINPNKTVSEANFRSSKDILDNNDTNSPVKKSILLKKKKINPNISLFKDVYDSKNIRQNILYEQNKVNKNSPEHISNNNLLKRKSKNLEENKRIQSKENSIVLEMNQIKNKIELEREREKENIKNIDVIEIFKKDKNLLKNIISYLKDNEIIMFTSSNNYLNKERIAFLDNKKEELLQILELKKDETMEIKIKSIKNEFSEEELSNPPNDFSPSEEALNKLKELNKSENIEIFKNDFDINNKENDILVIFYKILFVLLKEEKIYCILNDKIFWKKCSNYLIENSKGNIGDFISDKIPLFDFSCKSFNKIQNIIKDNKENNIKEIQNNKKFLIAPLIKEVLEYCGVILEHEKTQGNIIIKNLKNNQMIINYLNNLKVRYFLAKYEEDEED